MTTFQPTDGGLASTGLNENRDCTVRAVAVAAGIPYAEAHALLKKAGRRNGHKFPMVRFMCDVGNLHGYTPVPCSTTIGAKTVGQLLKKAPKGRFIATVSGHAFAIVDGVIHDTTTPRLRRRIKMLWKLEAL